MRVSKIGRRGVFQIDPNPEGGPTVFKNEYSNFSKNVYKINS